MQAPGEQAGRREGSFPRLHLLNFKKPCHCITLHNICVSFSLSLSLYLPFFCAQPPGEEAEQAGERALLGACAAIVAQLAQACHACCRVVVYHTAGLRSTVGALVATRQCGLAQALMEAALALARGPSSSSPSKQRAGGEATAAAVATVAAEE